MNQVYIGSALINFPSDCMLQCDGNNVYTIYRVSAGAVAKEQKSKHTHPTSGYNLFLKAMMPKTREVLKREGLSGKPLSTQAMRVIAQKWRDLNLSQQEIFNQYACDPTEENKKEMDDLIEFLTAEARGDEDVSTRKQIVSEGKTYWLDQDTKLVYSSRNDGETVGSYNVKTKRVALF
jgi:hypothetical protein